MLIAHVLKSIYFYYGSEWNTQLKLFTKCLYNVAGCMCLSSAFTSCIYRRNKVFNQASGDSRLDFLIVDIDPPDDTNILVILYFVWLYCFNNMQIKFNQISENIIFFEILNTIAIATYTI